MLEYENAWAEEVANRLSKAAVVSAQKTDRRRKPARSVRSALTAPVVRALWLMRLTLLSTRDSRKLADTIIESPFSHIPRVNFIINFYHHNHINIVRAATTTSTSASGVATSPA